MLASNIIKIEKKHLHVCLNLILVIIIVVVVQPTLGIVANRNAVGLGEEAVHRRRVEISPAFGAAVVLAERFVEAYADPAAWRATYLAHVRHHYTGFVWFLVKLCNFDFLVFVFWYVR
jgi:hypothetical protein